VPAPTTHGAPRMTRSSSPSDDHRTPRNGRLGAQALRGGLDPSS
jgi:hypothetical protein